MHPGVGLAVEHDVRPLRAADEPGAAVQAELLEGAFQPHLVSRTRIFGRAMGVALGAADEVVVMDIYVAREDPEPGVSAALVASRSWVTRTARAPARRAVSAASPAKE